MKDILITQHGVKTDATGRKVNFYRVGRISANKYSKRYNEMLTSIDTVKKVEDEKAVK